MLPGTEPSNDPVKISQFPVDHGPAAWNEILGPAPVRAALEEHRTAEWIVIGAGFAGLAAAHRLAELCPGDRIVVLEASRVAHGPAGRNSGFMIDVPHDLTSADYGGDAENDRREIRLNRAGIAYASRLCEQVGSQPETFAATGKVNGAITHRGVQSNNAYAAHLDQLSEPYERLGPHEMQALTGTHCYVDGLYTPGTAVIQPALYIRALASSVESNRVHVHELSPVRELKRVGTVWRAVTGQGSVSAPTVILCVNGHLQSFGYSPRQLMHVFTYASMSRSMKPSEVTALGGSSAWGITSADPLGTTVRRISGIGGDRLVIRNRATFDPSLQVSDARIQQVSRVHDRSFRYRFPMLPNLDMQYRWAGRLCLTRNSVPIFGELEPGLFSACCQNGLGTVKGTISGKLVAELACNRGSSLLDDMTTSELPKPLPVEPIASIGAAAVLRWGEFRAGKEL